MVIMLCKKLIGEKISLAPIVPEDVEKWYEWSNDMDTAICWGSEAYTAVTLEALRKEYNTMVNAESHVFSIVDNDSDTTIGRCLLLDINHINRSAKLEICIGDKSFRNKGCGREAVKFLADYAFNLLNLNSIVLLVYSYNQRAIRCYESAGFKVVGKRRQARLIGSKYYDLTVMDILAEEFTGTLVPQYMEAVL